MVPKFLNLENNLTWKFLWVWKKNGLELSSSFKLKKKTFFFFQASMQPSATPSPSLARSSRSAWPTSCPRSTSTEHLLMYLRPRWSTAGTSGPFSRSLDYEKSDADDYYLLTYFGLFYSRKNFRELRERKGMLFV